MIAGTDVFVIGGGPAGLAAAIAARMKGFRVTVADGVRPPIDKACGEGLLPDGLAALRELGVFLRPEDGFAFRGVGFVNEDASVETRFPGGEAAAGLGVRRPVLQRRMMERAAQLGVTFLWETPVVGLRDGGVAVAGALANAERARGQVANERVIAARWIVGADGSRSRVRNWSGLDAHARRESRFAYRRHYRITPWSDCTQVYWGTRGQAYVTPVGEREVCVVAITRDPSARFEQILREFTGLLKNLSGADISSSERGAVTSNHRLRRVTQGNVALIGDASGSVDAITGEGLCLSFHQAAALADALERGDLAGYQNAHRRLALRPTRMAHLMLAMDRRTSARRRVLRAFCEQPEIFKRFLAIHVGETSAWHIARTGAMFGWGVLTASV